MYGDSFIERQYIPYAIDVVNSAKKKLSLTLEAALIGISSLLERVFAYMDDALLVSLLNVSPECLLIDCVAVFYPQR